MNPARRIVAKEQCLACQVAADEDQLRPDVACLHELFPQILYCKTMGPGRVTYRQQREQLR